MPASLHRHTPALATIDPRGLSVRTIAYHRAVARDSISKRVNQNEFNARGHMIRQWDPRLNNNRQHNLQQAPNEALHQGLAGQVLKTESVDAGWSIAFIDAAGLLLTKWDSRFTQWKCKYDEFLRPVAIFEQPARDLQRCIERFVYTGSDPQDAQRNRCGQLVRHYDTAGSLGRDSFDLKSLPRMQARRFCQNLLLSDWPADETGCQALLESKVYSSQWQYDATGAAVKQADAAGHMRRFEMDVAGRAKTSYLDAQVLVKEVQYNAFSQVGVERAGNGVVTTASYSAVNNQLYSLKAAKADGTLLQLLNYEYDPAGNIERIEELALPVRRAHQKVESVSRYYYDTLYQLISATGGENASQSLGPALPGLAVGRVDDSRWRQYTQFYSYDSGGNLTDLVHSVNGIIAFHRRMVVDTHSNRSQFKVKDDSVVDFDRSFDANGNQQELAPGQFMQWGARNQLCQVTQVVREEANGQDDDVEIYVYDSGGQRVRKMRRAKTRGGGANQ